MKSVDISELQKFELSTGVYGKKYAIDEQGQQVVNPRSFADTILDIEKFPSAFNLSLPTGKKGPAGEIQKEQFYVPGALARGTYPDPLLAGERGLENVSRRLTHIVNMAKELSDVLERPDEFIDTDKIRKALPPIVSSWSKEAWGIEGYGKKKPTEQDESSLIEIMNKMSRGLSTERAPSPSLINTGGRSEHDYVFGEGGFLAQQMALVGTPLKSGKRKGEIKTKSHALATTISTINDLLVGKQEGTPEQLAAPTGLTRALDSGAGTAFAAALGIDVVQDTINKRVEALQKAKIDYYNTLAESATGKSGTINELFFSRKIPSVMGKAVTAVVDKSKDLNTFQTRLQKIESTYGESFSDQVNQLNTIAQEHSEAVKGYKKIGVPVLAQGELGVPEQFASKIPLEFMKKFKIDKDKGVLAQQPEKVSASLLDLLKYTEQLRTAAKEEGPNRQKEILRTN